MSDTVTPALTTDGRAFVAEYHLAMLSTVAKEGGHHLVAVGFTVGDDGIVRIITSDGSQKVRNVERVGRAAVGQVDGRRWISFEGPACVARDPEAVARAVDAYAERYRPPRTNPTRVVIEITVEQVLASAGLRSP